MRVIKSIACVALLILSCNKKYDCSVTDPGFASWESIRLIVKDQAIGNSLIPSKYAKTDIKVISDNNENKNIGFETPMYVTDNYGSCNLLLNSIVLADDVKNKEYCRRLFIDYKTDRDTLDYCYKIVSTVCDGSRIENLSVKYNGKIINKENPDNGDWRYVIYK